MATQTPKNSGPRRGRGLDTLVDRDGHPVRLEPRRVDPSGATIVPHGQALGMTEQLPAVERHNLSRTYLLNRLNVVLGGRTAEEIAFGEITTGAENDLVEATKLAPNGDPLWDERHRTCGLHRRRRATALGPRDGAGPRLQRRDRGPDRPRRYCCSRGKAS
jgi:hypothetical protein